MPNVRCVEKARYQSCCFQNISVFAPGTYTLEVLDIQSDCSSMTSITVTLDDVLEERSKELYWECTRRTDLIRFNKFTGSDLVWSFKGGATDGTAVDDFRSLYPLPTYDIVNNPNLSQNNGY